MSRFGGINTDTGHGMAAVGSAVLSGGTVTVNNSDITANSIILLTAQGGTLNLGFVYISSRIAGTSFTISSSNVLDARTIGYSVTEP